MLKKKFRLPVQHFPTKAKVVFNGSFITIKTAQNNLGYNRIGVIIRSGVIKKATQRNNIKRFIFNFFKADIGVITPKRDILIIFKKKTTNDKYKKELTEELLKVIAKLKE